MKQKKFTYGKYSYEYYLVKQDRKTVSIVVQPNLKIILKCPMDYNDPKIERFLKRKWAWLEKQLKYFKKYKKTDRKKEYVSGESFLYLGRQYKLIVIKSKESGVSLKKGQIHIFTTGATNDSVMNRKLLENWYRKRTSEVLERQFKEASEKFQHRFSPELVIRKMDTRWGSYISNKKIILNPMLIQASKECIDYVITHELCHMVHKRHDRNFIKLMESKIPHWEKVKEKLELRFV